MASESSGFGSLTKKNKSTGSSQAEPVIGLGIVDGNSGVTTTTTETHSDTLIESLSNQMLTSTDPHGHSRNSSNTSQVSFRLIAVAKSACFNKITHFPF